MKYGLYALALALAFGASHGTAAQPPPFVAMKCDADATRLGKARIPTVVLANGERLEPGDYEITVTSEHPSAAAGQSATAECWVEFARNGVVVAREVASVIPDSTIAEVAKGPVPRPNTIRVDTLKGGEYIRLWFNVSATNYLVHLPVASVREP